MKGTIYGKLGTTAPGDNFLLSNFTRRVCESFRDLFLVKKEFTSIEVAITEVHERGRNTDCLVQITEAILIPGTSMYIINNA